MAEEPSPFAKVESSDSCYEPVRLIPAQAAAAGARVLPPPDLSISMHFQVQLKDSSKKPCSARYLHGVAVQYHHRTQWRRGRIPGPSGSGSAGSGRLEGCRQVPDQPSFGLEDISRSPRRREALLQVDGLLAIEFRVEGLGFMVQYRA